MNDLLTEADVPYKQLVEMDDIDRVIEKVDVCIVIGANDVVNPAAREDESCAIYGMPIINLDYAKTVLVLKRSLASGFAGVDNPLFIRDNTRMLFGDAKTTLSALVSELKQKWWPERSENQDRLRASRSTKGGDENALRDPPHRVFLHHGQRQARSGI
jgi:NAD(P) transhydrogenase subunit beta